MMTKNQLLEKYNVPGPRYTSYPTVPFWDKTPDTTAWLDAVRETFAAHKNAQGVALYVHIPFCESLCTYCGCNTRITKNHAVSSPYIDSVLAEWQLYLKHLNVEKIPVSEIHLGGGTPTFMSADELKRLLDGILAHSTIQPGAEFSVEIDPRVTTPQQLQTMYDLGFRRVSMGIQDFDPTVQEIVNRVQPEALVAGIVDAARKIGYNSVNFDLIYGLPKQTEASIEQTFQTVLKMLPERIAYYSYAHVPWIKPSQRRFTEADLPDGTYKRRLYELGRKHLEDAGYYEIGMDHFALPTDKLWQATQERTLFRNFMGYTTKPIMPLIGLGVSAISDAWSAFIQNEKSLEKYQALVAKGELPILRGHLLSDEDQAIRGHILNLMTKFETTWTKDDPTSGHLSGMQTHLRELAADGIIELADNNVRITDQGRPFIRNVGMVFDARLHRSKTQNNQFSKTV